MRYACHQWRYTLHHLFNGIYYMCYGRSHYSVQNKYGWCKLYGLPNLYRSLPDFTDNDSEGTGNQGGYGAQ